MGVFYDNFVNALTLTVIALVIYIPARTLTLKKRGRRPGFKNEILKLVFVIYAFALAGMLLTPPLHGICVYGDGYYHFYINLPEPGQRLLNLIPFYTIKQQLEYSFNGSSLYPGAFTNLIANLVLFVPLPALMHSQNKKITTGRCLFICLAAILTVECIQYFIGRSADVDDVIFNMLGAAIGAVLCAAANRKGKRKRA